MNKHTGRKQNGARNTLQDHIVTKRPTCEERNTKPAQSCDEPTALVGIKRVCGLTLKQVYGLEHVRFDDAITFSSFEEHGDQLHLFEGHCGGFDGLDGFVGSMQAVDELTEHLQTPTSSRSLSLMLPPATITHTHRANTHTSVLEPLLEANLVRLRLAHSWATLSYDPRHQSLLQLGVVLLIDLTLNLTAQTVGRTFVCHVGSCWECQIVSIHKQTPALLHTP